MTVPVKHIGIFKALCDGRKPASLREDLSAEEYRRLGGKHRLVGEERYKVCTTCIKRATDWRWMAKYRRPKVRRADRTIP